MSVKGFNRDGRRNGFSRWSDILGYFVIIAVMVAGFAYVNASRQEATDQGRRILCTGIIANTSSSARDDSFVIKACGDVGVYRADFPPTVKP
jgi:hypothetical protein